MLQNLSIYVRIRLVKRNNIELHVLPKAIEEAHLLQQAGVKLNIVTAVEVFHGVVDLDNVHPLLKN